MVFCFAHLHILEDPDRHQYLIRSPLYLSQPLHKISLQSVHNRQADKQTNKPTLPKT